MRVFILSLIALAVMSTAAKADGIQWEPFAPKEKSYRQPAGIEVKGCGPYYIGQKDGRVHAVCQKKVGERWWWFDTGYGGNAG